MFLEDVPRFHDVLTTYRYAANLRIPQFLRDIGLEPQELDEVVALLGDRTRQERAVSITNEPTRFSDGTISVTYTALEPDTAEREAMHNCAKYASTNQNAERTMYYSRMAYIFGGSLKDLRPSHTKWPFLTASEYEDCQRIAHEAIAENLDGLLTPSAAHPAGTCLPVFQPLALSGETDEGLRAFRQDADQTEWRVLLPSTHADGPIGSE